MTQNTCEGVKLPEWEKNGQPHFSVEQVKAIISEAKPPLRHGCCGRLNVGQLNLSERIITVMRSRWGSRLKGTKNKKPRVFPISPQLCEALRFYIVPVIMLRPYRVLTQPELAFDHSY